MKNTTILLSNEYPDLIPREESNQPLESCQRQIKLFSYYVQKQLQTWLNFVRQEDQFVDTVEFLDLLTSQISETILEYDLYLQEI